MCSTRPPPRRPSWRRPGARPGGAHHHRSDAADGRHRRGAQRGAGRGTRSARLAGRAGVAGARRRHPRHGRRPRPRARAPSTASPRPSASPARRSRRSSTARRWSTASPSRRCATTRRSSYGGWTPENYGGGYAGPVTLQQALARSLNTVSVRLTLEVGPRRGGRVRPPAGPHRHPRPSRPLDRARRLRGDAAGDGGRLPGVPERRRTHDALPDQRDPHDARRRDLRATAPRRRRRCWTRSSPPAWSTC